MARTLRQLGQQKYLVASLDQSLKRMGLDYVDIFYHHRPDPNTPLEETVRALDGIVRSGKALYVGISNYNKGADHCGSRTVQGAGDTVYYQPEKIFHVCKRY